MSKEPLLSVEHVSASYGKSQVLRDVSLDVDDGEVVALLGRNGVGKTTTLRTISGVLPAESGSIHFDGEDITGLADFEISRRGISYVPEDRAIFPDLTVEENLRMGGIAPRAPLIDPPHVRDLLERIKHRDVRLPDVDSLFPRRGVPPSEPLMSISEVYDILPRLEERRSLAGSKLSGGEQQMLAIARALVKDTELLFLDEPTEGLAVQIVEDVRRLIEEIRDMGVPILLVEQNFEVAVRTADRAYILHHGEVVFDGAIETLVEDESLQERYLGVGISGTQ